MLKFSCNHLAFGSTRKELRSEFSKFVCVLGAETVSAALDLSQPPQLFHQSFEATGAAHRWFRSGLSTLDQRCICNLICSERGQCHPELQTMILSRCPQLRSLTLTSPADDAANYLSIDLTWLFRQGTLTHLEHLDLG